MFVVDTDCFSEILAGVSRYAALDRGVRSIAVVTAEEVFRGRLAAIRADHARHQFHIDQRGIEPFGLDPARRSLRPVNIEPIGKRRLFNG